MAKKKKSKKQKKPNIPVQTMARPRLEQILIRRQYGELDDDEYVSSIKTLMVEIGREAVLNALVGLLDNANVEQKEALMVAISKLGNEQTIKHLWQLVRRSKMSMGGKMTALVILHQIGEDVDLDNPGRYFSLRDLKSADLSEVADIVRFALLAVIKDIQQAKNTDEIEAIMMQSEKIIPEAGREETMMTQIEELINMGDTGAADMLAAISATTPRPKVREAARLGLLKLSGQKVFPQSEMVKSLRDEPFYYAYSTDPAHPWQQGVTIAWERPYNTVQAMVFLIDFGSPWQGAIKNMFVTYSMLPSQLQREFINNNAGIGADYRRVTYARARQFILTAIEANRKNRVKFPKEYEEFLHLMERRIIDPSPEALTYAEQVDAKTVDEWGELDREPVRGKEIIGPDGIPMSVITMDNLDGEEEECDLDDLLFEVEEFYLADEEEFDGEKEEEEPILPYNWAVNYLSARYNEGIEVYELDDRWGDICDFLFYMEGDDDAPSTLADIQDCHLSGFITEFWVEEIGEKTSIEHKQQAMEAIRDLYDYLAAQGHIPVDSAKRVAKATTNLFS